MVEDEIASPERGGRRRAVVVGGVVAVLAVAGVVGVLLQGGDDPGRPAGGAGRPVKFRLVKPFQSVPQFGPDAPGTLCTVVSYTLREADAKLRRDVARGDPKAYADHAKEVSDELGDLVTVGNENASGVAQQVQLDLRALYYAAAGERGDDFAHGVAELRKDMAGFIKACS